MIYNSKKKALYEVIGRAGAKPSYEHLHPDSTESQQPSSNTAQTSGVVRWKISPSAVQFNAGRIEISIPYQVAIAVVLGILLAAVVLFRVGQSFGNRADAVNPPAAKTVVNKPAAKDVQAIKTRPVQPKQEIEQSAQTAAAGPVGPVSTGKNRIVLKIYQVRSHLEPVKEYFDKMGVATEILEKGSWFYLVTKNKYDNPERQGTDGFVAKQKIIELGTSYKAPVGFETFGPKPFSDAFGMKFED